MSSLDNLQETHFISQKVFIFDIPKTAGGTLGYRAADWPKTAMWTGRLRVSSKGDNLFILLEHTDKEGLFASCPVNNPNVIEKVTDSSRYFALRISDGKGRHAVVGLGFQAREEAFDFKVAMQDFENRNKAPSEKEDKAPIADFTLPQGGKIHVNLPGAKKDPGEGKKQTPSAQGVSPLAPPPVAGKAKRKDDGKADVSQPAPNSSVEDIFGFDKLQIEGKPKTQPASSTPAQASVQQAQAQPKVTTAASTPSEWVTFD